MADDKSKVGVQDRSRVSAEEDWEVRHLAERFKISTAEAIEAIRKHGPSLDAIEKALRDRTLDDDFQRL